MKMNILTADDQTKVRSAIRLLIEQQPDWNIVNEAGNVQELFSHMEYYCPDVLILDWKLAGLASGKLIRMLHSQRPGLYIVVLDSNPQTGQMALEAGADRFVSKNDPAERLLAAISSLNDVDKKRLEPINRT